MSPMSPSPLSPTSDISNNDISDGTGMDGMASKSALADGSGSSILASLTGRKGVAWSGIAVMVSLVSLFAFSLNIVVHVLEPYLSTASRGTLTMIAIVLTIIAVPLTHWLSGSRQHRLKGYALWQPFVGGFRFVLLQAIAWSLYSSVVLAVIFVGYRGVKHIAIEALASLGAGGVLAQLLFLLSLHFFTASSQPSTAATTATSRRRGPLLGWWGVGNVGVALTLFSFALAVLVENLEMSTEGSIAVSTIAGASVLIAVPLTHFLAGSRRYAAEYTFRPFAGGTRFVALQAVGWSLWAATVLFAIFAIYMRAQLLHFHLSGFISMAGITGVLAQSMVLLSLRYFDSKVSNQLCGCIDRKDAEELVDSSLAKFSLSEWRQILESYKEEWRSFQWLEWLRDVRAFWVVVTLYSIVPVGTVITFSPIFIIAAWPDYGWLILLMILLPYCSTFVGRPNFTGSRTWHSFRANTFLWGAIERYFQSNVIGEAKLVKGERYLFCFGPHGIYPLTTMWATTGPSFRKLYPDIEVTTCGASVLFFCPVLRDFLMWAGARDVSRPALALAYEQGRNVCLVPGGQREMRMSRGQLRNQMNLSIKHKGFVKLAIQTGAHLVPMISFGEDQLLLNIYAPTMQAITTKFIGFGLPFFPHGRWYAPLPNRVKVTVAYGPVVRVPHLTHPTDDDINRIHSEYYEMVRYTFEKHKVAAGYPDCVLNLAP